MSRVVEDKLREKYLSILTKHNNPKWALDELKYLVYEAYLGEYKKLDNRDKEIIDFYILALHKIG